MKSNFISLLNAKVKKASMKLRKAVLKKSGAKIGNSVQIGKIKCEWPNSLIIGDDCELQDDTVFRVQKPFDPTNFIKIGNRVFIGNNCEFNSGESITIGNDCLIASNNIFVDIGHEIKIEAKIKEQKILCEKIILEDDVWLGTNCKVLRGVTIGKGSVIGAGSVINKSIPPFQVWAGVPARFIKNR